MQRREKRRYFFTKKAAFTDPGDLSVEIRVSLDCMYFAFFIFCIYIEKDVTRISAHNYAWSVKATKRNHSMIRQNAFLQDVKNWSWFLMQCLVSTALKVRLQCWLFSDCTVTSVSNFFLQNLPIRSIDLLAICPKLFNSTHKMRKSWAFSRNRTHKFPRTSRTR